MMEHNYLIALEDLVELILVFENLLLLLVRQIQVNHQKLA